MLFFLGPSTVLFVTNVLQNLIIIVHGLEIGKLPNILYIWIQILKLLPLNFQCWLGKPQILHGLPVYALFLEYHGSLWMRKGDFRNL